MLRLGVYGGAWSVVLVLSWFTFRRGQALGGTAAWAGLLHPVVFGLTAWPVLRRFARGDRWITIPNAFLGFTYLAIGLGAVYFVFSYDSLSYSALRRPTDVQNALLVAVAGIVAYRIGAEGRWFDAVIKRLPSLPSTLKWSSTVRLGVFAAIGIGVGANVYLAATGSLGYVTGHSGTRNPGVLSIIRYISETGVLALSGAYFYWFSGASLSRADRGFLVLATVVLAGLGLLSGMKEEFFLVFFGVVIPYTLTWESGLRRRLGRGQTALLASILIVAAFLLFAVNPLFRQNLAQLRGMENRIEQGTAATFMVSRDVATGDGIGSLLITGAEKAWSRLSIFPYHLAVVDQVPESQPYRGFDRYPLLPAMAIVPRVVWPEKPANVGSTEFQRRFISSNIVFSTTPTVYGWSYMESGVIGVGVLLLALGMITGIVEKYLAKAHPPSVMAVVLYTSLFVTLGDPQQDVFWQIIAIPKVLAIGVMVYALFRMPGLLSRHRKPPRRGFEVS